MLDPSQLWEHLPARQVRRLTHISAESAYELLDPTPSWAPVLLACRPLAHPQFDQVVDALLDDLAQVTSQLVDAWGHEARRIAAQGGAVSVALHELGRQISAPLPVQHTFWSFACERVQAGRSLRGAHPREVEALELSNLLRMAYDRPHIALFVQLPDANDNPTATDTLLAQGLEWLAFHSHAAIGVCSTDRRPVFERFACIELPWDTSVRPDPQTLTRASPVPTKGMLAPPVEGMPHPASPTERRLHAALCQADWARGASYNRTLTVGAFDTLVRVDVLWMDLRVVLEIDGPDHRREPKYSRDRARDNLLQIQGYRVMRLTNEQVEHDLDDVLVQIREFLNAASYARNTPGEPHGSQ